MQFVSLILAVGTTLASPLPRLQLTSSLTIDARYLEQNQRAPSEGVLLSLGDFAQIKAELTTQTENCELRLQAAQAQALTQIELIQSGFQERTVAYVERIDTLNAELARERNLHARTESEYKGFRWMAYGIGGGLITASALTIWAVAK